MQTTLPIEIPKSEEINQGVIDISDQALSLVVVDNDSFKVADELLNDIKAMANKIKIFFEPHKKNAHKAWRSLCEAETAELSKLEPAMEHIKIQNKRYLAEQERKRQEEENRLRLEAQKVEEERRLADAAQLEAEGLKEEAEAVLEAPQPIVMPTVEETTPKADMRLYRKVWKFRIIDETKIPREYMTPDLIKIGGVVRALKGKCKITGIEVYEE